MRTTNSNLLNREFMMAKTGTVAISSEVKADGGEACCSPENQHHSITLMLTGFRRAIDTFMTLKLNQQFKWEQKTYL